MRQKGKGKFFIFGTARLFTYLRWLLVQRVKVFFCVLTHGGSSTGTSPSVSGMSCEISAYPKKRFRKKGLLLLAWE